MSMNVSPVAYCSWIERMGAVGTPERGWYYFDGSDFVQAKRNVRDLPIQHICRASVGERIVTVWLPRGGKIRLRRTHGADAGRYRHTYGRDRESGIEIYVPAARAELEARKPG